MRNSKKNELRNDVAEQYTIHDAIPDISNENWKKAVNGGMLLHKLPWQIGNTFSSTLARTWNMLMAWENAFTSFLMATSQDHCHRKCNPIQSRAIELTSFMLLYCRKYLFLPNNGNKQMFIDLFAIRPISAGHVFQYTDDADTIIVDRAIEIAEEFNKRVRADIVIFLINKLKLSTPNTVYIIQEKSERAINTTTLIRLIPEAKRKHTIVSCNVRMWDYINFFWYWKDKIIQKSNTGAEP